MGPDISPDETPAVVIEKWVVESQNCKTVMLVGATFDSFDPTDNVGTHALTQNDVTSPNNSPRHLSEYVENMKRSFVW
jgi:hypothetical protein